MRAGLRVTGATAAAAGGPTSSSSLSLSRLVASAAAPRGRPESAATPRAVGDGAARLSRSPLVVVAAAAAAASSSSSSAPTPRNGVVAAAAASSSSSSSAPTPRNGGDMSAVPKTELDWSKAPAPGEKRLRRPENVQGALWIDTKCISCRVCRNMAPTVFGKANGQSAVLRAPAGEDERLQAYRALLSCPTHSIHDGGDGGKPDPALLRAARDSFPIPAFLGAERVFFNGFTDFDAIATQSYLVKRGDGSSSSSSGNGSGSNRDVLFDAPRFAGPVVEALARECGPDGPAYFVLSHRDDIGHHERWAERFPKMRRVVHEREAAAVESLKDCEVILRGEGPWRLPDGGDDVLILLTPGHTSGSITLLYAPEQVALTGDHLDAAPPPAEFGVVPPPAREPGQVQDLHVFRDYCWGSIDEQLASVAKLHGRGCIRRVLPGHGSAALFGGGEGEFDAAVERLLAAELPGGSAEAGALIASAREARAREPAPVVAVEEAVAASAATPR